jgi:Cu2+-exporting ATPase
MISLKDHEDSPEKTLQEKNHPQEENNHSIEHEHREHPEQGHSKHGEHKENKRTEHEGHTEHLKQDHTKHEEHVEHEHKEHLEHDEHPEHNHHDHHQAMMADFKKRFIISLIITVPVFFLSEMVQELLGLHFLSFQGDIYILFLLSSFVFFYGGYPFFTGMVGELKVRQPGMMTLVAVAITTAYIYSAGVTFGLMGMTFYLELVTLIDIMLLGHWIEMRSVMGASRALQELATLLPKKAHRIGGEGKVEDVPLEHLQVDDLVLVKPGEKVPADGIIKEGQSYINESLLTGESKPILRSAGEGVIGGSINGESSIKIMVEKIGEDSFISQVVSLVEEAQESKSHTQDLANRAAFWLTIVALSGGLITLLVWLGMLGQDLSFALERAVTVMVTTCPHALGLAIPLVVAVSTAISAKNGVLIRDRQSFENMKNIHAVIFDKTGTLTEGKFGVTDVISFKMDDFSEEEILKYAASVEKESEHPVAQGILKSAQETYPIKDFHSHPGEGVQALVGDHEVKVVSPAYIETNKLEITSPELVDIRKQPKTVVYVVIDGEAAGAIALADVIRPESKNTILKLQRQGIQCMMLTGDNEDVARWVAEELGLDEYFYRVLPHEKALKVREVQEKGYKVAMVGDGVNDAPALTQADVGISIGAGTDVAMESADVVLVKSNPADMVTILGLTKATYSKMWQNLLWATGYNAFAIPLAAGLLYSWGILLSPAMGAVLMSLSTVIVAFNAQLLRINKI